MSERVRVVLAVEHTLPESVRVELDSSLEGAGWFSASEDYTCWVCRAKIYETVELERQVNKMMEFAAFNAGVEGRLSFALKVGEGSPKVCSTRVGNGGLKTRPVLPKSKLRDGARAERRDFPDAEFNEPAGCHAAQDGVLICRRGSRAQCTTRWIPFGVHG